MDFINRHIVITLLVNSIIIVSLTLQEKLPHINTSGLECGEDGDCMSGPIDCEKKCGCDSVYYYNETTGECSIKYFQLMKILVEKYNPQDTENIHESILAKKVRIEAEQVFQGILISAVLFISCASVCALTACIYCFRISFMDNRLKSDVIAISEKAGREQRFRSVKKTTKIDPIAENCAVVVDDGVFVV